MSDFLDDVGDILGIRESSYFRVWKKRVERERARLSASLGSECLEAAESDGPGDCVREPEKR